MSARIVPEAWLVVTGSVPAGEAWDEAVAGMALLRPLGLEPRVALLRTASTTEPADWPLPATIIEASSFLPVADARSIRDAIDHLADRRGRPAMLVAMDDDPAVVGLARLAVRWDCRVLARVRSWRVVTTGALDCTCEGLGASGTEHSLVELAGTIVLTLSGSFGAQGRPPTPVDAVAEVVTMTAAPTDVQVVRLLDEVAPVADMTVAPVVVAGGLGLGSAVAVSLVEELADALGGVVGGTRPIVDMGWLPTDRLIGATGRGISPDLYIALGISGATQHISSVRAGTVISVNIDPAATMTRMADLGLVGDVHEVVPALLDAIREHRR